MDVRFPPNWEFFYICIDKSRVGFLIESYDRDSLYSSRVLQLHTTINSLPSWFNSVVTKRAKKIIYCWCRDLNNILVECSNERLHGLMSLNVMNCVEMVSLMNITTISLVPNKPVLENLEKLYVGYMANLKELCVGNLPHGSLSNLKLLTVHNCKALVNIWNGPTQYSIFHNLTHLKVSRCEELKSFFTVEVSMCLLQLESLQVDYCDSLETIIGPRKGTLKNKILFPHLNYLSFEALPQLKSLYSGGNAYIQCPSLECVDVGRCPKLRISTSDFHSLKQIQVKIIKLETTTDGQILNAGSSDSEDVDASTQNSMEG